MFHEAHLQFIQVFTEGVNRKEGSIPSTRSISSAGVESATKFRDEFVVTSGQCRLNRFPGTGAAGSRFLRFTQGIIKVF